MNKLTKIQTLANRGPDLTFVNDAGSTRLSPKPSSSQVVKLIDRTRVTRPRGRSRVTGELSLLPNDQLFIDIKSENILCVLDCVSFIEILAMINLYF